MRFICFCILLLCCCLVACNNSADYPEDISFPREETITHTLMSLQGLTAPMRVEVCHPFLMIQNDIRRDSVFHIYDLRNYELTSAFGVIGQGPDDYVRPWILNTQFSGFTISDGDNAIYQISINEEGQPVSKEKREVRFFDGPGDAAFINDSLFVRDARYLAPSLYLLSLEDELPRKTLQFRSPRIIDYYVDPDMADVRANANRIALFYYRKRQIDFMDTDFNLIKSVRAKFPRPPRIINDGNLRDVKMGYVGGYFGKKYLYVKYFGKSVNEYQSNPSAHRTFLEVFDLEGNPVVRYRLGGMSTHHFVVDEETFTLYGATHDDTVEDALVVYQLIGLQ